MFVILSCSCTTEISPDIVCFDCVGRGPITPLHRATQDGNIKEVERLLNEGVDVNSTHNGSTALNRASVKGNAEMVLFLISKGADVNYTGLKGLGSPPLSDVENVEVAKILLKNGADIHFRDGLGTTCLDRAIYSKKPELAVFFIEQGADVHNISDEGWTPILHSVQNGLDEVTKALF